MTIIHNGIIGPEVGKNYKTNILAHRGKIGRLIHFEWGVVTTDYWHKMFRTPKPEEQYGFIAILEFDLENGKKKQRKTTYKDLNHFWDYNQLVE